MTDIHRRTLAVRVAAEGVGLGPYVYRLAQERELSGFVRNEVSMAPSRST